MVSTIIGGAKGEPLLKFVKRHVQEVQECRKDVTVEPRVEPRTEPKEKESSKIWYTVRTIELMIR